MNKWDYGEAYKRYPCETGTITFQNGSKLKVHDIFEPLPDFMKEADLVFTDPPWNMGNLSTFYTKADMEHPEKTYEEFYKRLFECIQEIHPNTCYVEVGKENIARFILEMEALFPYVTFYNSTYYRRKENICYVVRGSSMRTKPKLDYIDEKNIIEWVCQNEEYDCIADLCMGRGLVAEYAFRAGKRFVGTELNHKRLSVCIDKITQLGEGMNKIREARLAKGLTQKQLGELIGVSPTHVQKWEYGLTPNTKNLSKLSQVLGIPMEDIIVQKKEP